MAGCRWWGEYGCWPAEDKDGEGETEGGKDPGTDACTAIKDEVACGASAQGALHPFPHCCAMRRT